MNSSLVNSKSSTSLPFNKTNFQVLEQEKNLLKITLEYVLRENEIVKGQIDDMRMTVRTNKELLKEYVDRITNKDKVVEKMSSTIEQLHCRIKSLEEHIKHL